MLTLEQVGRRDRILSLARELLTDRGLAGVTMRELAERSGVTLKTLYDIYGGKDELLVAAVRERVNAVFAERDNAGGLKGVPRLLYYVDLHSNGVRSTPAFSRAVAPLLAGPVDRFGARERYLRLHGPAFDDIREAGELRPGADPVRLIEALMVAMLGVLLVWAKEQISSDELFALNRLCAAQAVLPAVTGRSARAVMAVIDAYYSFPKSQTCTSFEWVEGPDAEG